MTQNFITDLLLEGKSINDLFSLDFSFFVLQKLLVGQHRSLVLKVGVATPSHPNLGNPEGQNYFRNCTKTFFFFTPIHSGIYNGVSHCAFGRSE